MLLLTAQSGDDKRGWTALFYAAWNGRTDCMRLLVKAGADKKIKDDVRVLALFLKSSYDQNTEKLQGLII